MKYTEYHFEGYHRVLLAEDDSSGLRAVIAVHNINLGPALGGCRVLEYDSLDCQMNDALKLSKGMTYKSALAGNSLGGGKATIQGPLTDDKLKAFGEAMNYLNKDYTMYYTAADVGTTGPILEKVAKVTKFVNYKGSDCSIATAYGVYCAMVGAVTALNRDLATETVSILGYGKVGKQLANFLLEDRVFHVVSDINPPFKSTPYGAMDGLIPHRRGFVDHKTAHRKGTIFSPCALGGILNESTVPDIPENTIVCGGANNQLQNSKIEDILYSKNITYVPDYLANAGGIIVTAERGSELVDLEYDSPAVLDRLKHITTVAHEVIKEHKYTGKPTSVIADRMAEERFMK